MAFDSHEAYLASVPVDVGSRLAAIQARVESSVPGTERCIGYGMPAFRRGKIFFYFAAFRRHIGVYPPIRQDEKLIGELAPYRNAKGNLAFPLREPLPLELIGRVAQALSRKYGGDRAMRRSTRATGPARSS